MDDVLNTSTH